MDTKSKNIKYRLGTKVVAVIIMWASLVGSLGSGLFVIANMDVISTSSYYDTQDFKMKISRLIHNVVELNTSLKDAGEEGDGISISDGGVKNVVVTEIGEATQGDTEIPKVKEFTEGAEISEVTASEMPKVHIFKNTVATKEEAKEKNEETTEETEVIESKVNQAERDRRKNIINNNLSRAVNFNYYIKDLETGEISYKLADGYDTKLIKNAPNHIYISKDDIPYDLNYYGDLERMLVNSPHEMYVLMSDPLMPGDEFYDEATWYTQVKELSNYAIAMLISTLVLFLISSGYLVFVSGRKEKDGEIFLADIDRIYSDVQSLFVLIAAVISMAIVFDIDLPRRYGPELIIILIIFAIDMAIGMTYFFSMLRQFKKGVLFKNTLIYKSIKSGINLISTCFNEEIFKPWIIGFMLLYGLINGILFIVAIDQEVIFYPLFIVPFNALVVYFTFKTLKSLSIIMYAAEQISEGNLDYEIDQKEISLAFLSFAQDIQSIQGGLKNAVNNAIKGERMKTDLITNVSHDLKTPLTSIINYVDLLKQENIENETAAGYLNILDEKSDRLKNLIEDLIEASKASSGNITITTEQVDLGELVTQACGEYEEKIKEAQLDIRINNLDEKIWILADGKYMWRILENMMSNVLKYSMANSRVYIHIEQNNGYGVLVMKNISAYPLDIDPSELTDRFIRADESRTTEGSGLGLSIAQSLASIQGGSFNIEIDGDLFKVIVGIPLWVE